MKKLLPLILISLCSCNGFFSRHPDAFYQLEKMTEEFAEEEIGVPPKPQPTQQPKA